jgi:hypothetical protein
VGGGDGIFSIHKDVKKKVVIKVPKAKINLTTLSKIKPCCCQFFRVMNSEIKGAHTM